MSDTPGLAVSFAACWRLRGRGFGAVLLAASVDGVLLAASVDGVLLAASVDGVLLAASVGRTLSPSAGVVVLHR
jgi:hypothetical protein